jgi:hypothetical protein
MGGIEGTGNGATLGILTVGDGSEDGIVLVAIDDGKIVGVALNTVAEEIVGIEAVGLV